MFPSLLPQTTRSTLETAPKLVDFCVWKSYLNKHESRAEGSGRLPICQGYVSLHWLG